MAKCSYNVTEARDNSHQTTNNQNGTVTSNDHGVGSSAATTKVYKRRWVMLFIFVLVFMINAFQWIQFSIINNLMSKYYGVGSQTVDWTSLIYMIVYIPLIFPGVWIMDKMGLRVTVLIGAIGSTASAWINVLGVSPDRFFVIIIGQTVASIAQVFLLGVAPNVAAVWFGPNQVSLACSLGVFGSQIGVALGFLIPPVMVKDHDNIEDIGTDLQLMLFIIAGFCTVLLFVVVFVFQAKPPLPPSAAQSLSMKASPTALVDFFQSVKNTFTNQGFLLLFVSYGINVGVFYAMSTLLNQTVLLHFPGEEANAGRIGLTIVVSGMLGSVTFGAVLDKTHLFRETTLVTYFFALLGMAAYTFTFQFEYIAVTFVVAGIVGFFMTGYLPVGFEFAAELTYPEPEVMSAGLLNASAQAFGIAFTLLGGWLMSTYESSSACNSLLSAALLIGLGLTFPIRSELRRQKANQQASSVTTEIGKNNNP